VEGAAFVLCAIRAGQLEGRVVDGAARSGSACWARRRPDPLGQETTGPGGICFVAAHDPPMVALAETIAGAGARRVDDQLHEPRGHGDRGGPAGAVDRAVGVCDSPSGLCRRVARAPGRERDEPAFEYFGLNHLGRLKGVRDRDDELLPALLADDAARSSFEEGRLFGGDWLPSLEMIPDLYLFYCSSDTAEAIRERPASRGAIQLEQQHGFYAQDGQGPRLALAAWRATRHAPRAMTASARTWRRRAARRARRRARDRGERRLRGRGDGGARGDGAGHARRAHPQHRETLGAAGARRPSGGRGPGARRPRRPAPARRGAGARARRRARRADQGRRARDDRGCPDGLANARDPRALHPLVPSVSTALAIFDGYRERLPALAAAFPG
jgi:6-phospho-beta-glucosidase